MSDPTREFKDRAYEQLARVGKSVSSPRRIELLDLLAQAPRAVAELAEEASLSVANTSQHLQTLREARLVETERRGNHVIYRLASGDVSDFVVALRRLAEERLAELHATESDFFDAFDDEAVQADQIWERIANGEVTVVDVRPEREFEAGHIQGALSIPVDELEARLGELPADRDVVVYCRGPFCTFAPDAVELLEEHGFNALRLREGYADWRASGLTHEARPSDDADEVRRRGGFSH
jgi:rhodanese-related sulfurtransferase/DNA-binding transcriptional ArsR family regulator